MTSSLANRRRKQTPDRPRPGQEGGLLASRKLASEQSRFRLPEVPPALLLSIAVFGFCGSALGMISIACIFLPTGYMLYLAYRKGPMRLLSTVPLLAFPLYQVLTTVWSLAPEVSFRYSLQLLVTCLVGVLGALLCSPAGLIVASFAGSGVILVLSFASGIKGPSAEGYVLVGLMGSKDGLALLGQLVFQTGLAVLLLGQVPRWGKLAAIPITGLGMVGAVTVHAATGVITLFLGLLIFGGLFFVRTLPMMMRIMTLLIGAIGFGTIGAHWTELNKWVSETVLPSLGKDPTLTGRTVLWDFAREFIAERPWLGRGYKEIWLGHTEETFGLLRWAGIEDGRTFFFHQSYLEAQVDSGYIGLAIMCITFAVMGIYYISALLRWPTVPSLFFLTMFTLLIVRSFGETLMQPFSFNVCLIYMGFASVALRARQPSEPRPRYWRLARQPAASAASEPAQPAV